MEREQINHLGVVEAVHGNTAQVKIQNQSACAGCHAKGACSSADSSEKLVDITLLPNQSVKQGELVTILGNYSMGLKAATYAYILPFILVVTALFIGIKATDNELYGGLIALFSLVPYYAIIYLSKQKLEKTFVFTIQN